MYRAMEEWNSKIEFKLLVKQHLLNRNYVRFIKISYFLLLIAWFTDDWLILDRVIECIIMMLIILLSCYAVFFYTKSCHFMCNSWTPVRTGIKETKRNLRSINLYSGKMSESRSDLWKRRKTGLFWEQRPWKRNWKERGGDFDITPNKLYFSTCLLCQCFLTLTLTFLTLKINELEILKMSSTYCQTHTLHFWYNRN